MVTASKILNAKLLIVDDEKPSVLLLEKLLREASYTDVTSTMDPHAVAALHREHHYDLILLDLQMPGLDGFQVMEELKAIESESYIPVLVIAAERGHKLRALQAGAKDFVSKPFDLAELKTRVYNMLEVRLLYKALENHNMVLERTVQERTVELQESEARFRGLTELSTDWYWESDENLRITMVSGPILDMLGIRIGASIVEAIIFPRSGWNEAECAGLEASIKARMPFVDVPFSRVNADGSRQSFLASGQPIFDRSFGFLGYRGVGVEVLGTGLEPDGE